MKLTKNPYYLGFFLVLINNVLTPFVDFVLSYFKINYSSGLAIALIGATYIGKYYTKQHKEILSKNSRWKIAFTYFVINLPLTLIGVLFLNKTLKGQDFNLYFIVITIIISFILSIFLIYWSLWIGGKQELYLSSIKKKT